MRFQQIVPGPNVPIMRRGIEGEQPAQSEQTAPANGTAK
jgi:hypothetical protein